MSDISKNIRQLRTAKGMSQSQLAEKLSVTRQTVSSWERAVSFPDVNMLGQLAEALEAELDELIYPDSHVKKATAISTPLTGSFVAISIVVYVVLFLFGGPMFAVPLMKKVLGGGVSQEFILMVYWGLILLVGYVGLCTCLISEYVSGSSKRVSDDDSAIKDE